MVKFSYENLNVENKDEFENATNFLINEMLAEQAYLLDEIIITSDIELSLKLRLDNLSFNRWIMEQKLGKYPTAAKIISSFENNGHYKIVFLNTEVFIKDSLPMIIHELIHFIWYNRKDMLINKKELHETDLERIDTFFNIVSEYDACYIEIRFRSDKSNSNEWNLEDEARGLIKIYKDNYRKNNVDFQRAMNIGLGEFNSILVRHLGFMDGIKNEKKINDELNSDLFTEMFDSTLLKMVDLIRIAVKYDEKKWEKQALDFNNLITSEIDNLNNYILKLIRSRRL